MIEFDNMEVDKTNNIAIYKINPDEIFNPEYITKYYMDNRKVMKCLLYRRYMIVTFKDKTQFISYLLSLSSNVKTQFIKQ